MNVRHDELKGLAILEGAVENTTEAFVTIDENHKVLFFNKAAERIFGFSRDEVIGHDLDRIMSPTCSRDHRKAVARYIETRVPRRIGHGSEVSATRKGGKVFPASISFSVSEVGGRLFFTGIVKDLTQTKELQNQIIRSERLAALGQFVAEITHEIKNPLMMIGGFVRQLVGRTRDEGSLKKLNIILEEVQRLETLLAELRDFYLPKNLGKEEIDLRSLLREVHSLIKEDCDQKKIGIDFKIDATPIKIEGDHGRLKQVFLNLAKNAIEAMDEGGDLQLRADVKGQKVEISVADNGCGIPKDDLDKIFSPFFTTKSYGTGLGLSISKRIIEDHEDGSLTMESEEGKGTVFKISMPICRTETND